MTHSLVYKQAIRYLVALTSAKINISYSILFNLTTSYSSYFEGKKGISRNKTSFFLLMKPDLVTIPFPIQCLPTLPEGVLSLKALLAHLNYHPEHFALKDRQTRTSFVLFQA